MPARKLCRLAALLCGLPLAAHAQTTDDGFWSRWRERSERSKVEQPHWITPVATTTPRLEQEFRYDFDWSQAVPGQVYTNVLGNAKGLELIPFDPVEVIVAVPSYTLHHDPARPNGWGDSQFLVKYRIIAADEVHGDYILTAFLGSSFPTGTNGNGQAKAIVTPTLAYGKGWDAFDMQGTISAAEPVALTSRIGRTYTWNHTIQLRVVQRIWPEVELNQTWFSGGKNDGREQTFVTPGLVVGRLPITRYVGLTVGTGVQLAVSKFHTTDHNVILSLRAPF